MGRSGGRRLQVLASRLPQLSQSWCRRWRPVARQPLGRGFDIILPKDPTRVEGVRAHCSWKRGDLTAKWARPGWNSVPALSALGHTALNNATSSGKLLLASQQPISIRILAASLGTASLPLGIEVLGISRGLSQGTRLS